MDFSQIPDAVYLQFSKGDHLMEQGEKVDYVYYLVSGSCYRSMINDKGDEFVYNTKDSGEGVRSVLGALAAYTKEASQVSYIAKEDIECYQIPIDNFKKAIERDPDILTVLLELAIAEGQRLKQTFLHKQQRRVDYLVCKLLLEQRVKKNGVVMLNEQFTNEEIARFIGIHKVSVCRIIKKIKDQGIVERKGKRLIILDEERLKEYVESDCEE